MAAGKDKLPLGQGRVVLYREDMTDPQVPTPTGVTPAPTVPPVPAPSTDATTPAAPSKSPLEILEEMLQASRTQGPAALDTNALDGGQPAASPAAPAAAEEPQPTQADTQAAMDAHAIVDQEQIQQQLAQMQEIKNTPEYQARIAQDSAKATEEASKNAQGDGFQIKQLGHTKL